MCVSSWGSKMACHKHFMAIWPFIVEGTEYEGLTELL